VPGLLTRWRLRRMCWHHDRRNSESWIAEQLIDVGMRKMFWCTECGRMWIV